MNVADVYQQPASVHAATIRGRNGFDGVESGGECKQVRYDHNSSNFLIANNNYYYDQRLAA